MSYPAFTIPPRAIASVWTHSIPAAAFVYRIIWKEGKGFLVERKRLSPEYHSNLQFWVTNVESYLSSNNGEWGQACHAIPAKRFTDKDELIAFLENDITHNPCQKAL